MNGDDRMETQLDSFDGDLIPPALAVKAMRDSGYKDTAHALAELIDNSIQANASSVEVFCVEERTRTDGAPRSNMVKIGVLDNGDGMDEATLRLALQFGNGTHLNDRDGIGRFGMGLPNASISQCRHVDVWTWQAGPDNAIYVYLDLDEIGTGEMKKVPVPQKKAVLKEWRERAKDMGTSGTLVVWSGFDEHRLVWKTGRSTLKHTETLVGRIYRKFINAGKASIRLVEIVDDKISSDKEARVNDPLYLMSPSSTSGIFGKEPMFQRWGEEWEEEFGIEYQGETHKVCVRMSYARPETKPKSGDRGSQDYGKHAKANIGVSVVRGGRELELDSAWAIAYDPTERWWGVEVEFPPALDEVFGVTNNKQHATVFSKMAHFDEEAACEPGESYMDFRRRLKEEGDPEVELIDIAKHINDQLHSIRKRLKDQTKGTRDNRGKRHEEDLLIATTDKWNKRAEQGKPIESDGQQFDVPAQEAMAEDLRGKQYSDGVARGIVAEIISHGLKVIFVKVHNDESPAFFSVEEKSGGVTEVVFNESHPACKKLVKTLDDDIPSETSASDLVERIENASDALKLIFAAWARYEAEDVPHKDQIREIRQEWGKMAKSFLAD